MKSFFAILLMFGLCGNVLSQSVRTLGYNAGGAVIYSGTNQLTFTNAVNLSTGNTTNSSVGTRVDLALALWDAVNDTAALQIRDNEVTLSGGEVATNFRNALGLNATNGTGKVYAATAIWDAGDGGAAALQVDDSDIIIRSAMATTNAPTNTTDVVRWLRVIEGTNNYRIPLYK